MATLSKLLFASVGFTLAIACGSYYIWCRCEKSSNIFPFHDSLYTTAVQELYRQYARKEIDLTSKDYDRVTLHKVVPKEAAKRLNLAILQSQTKTLISESKYVEVKSSVDGGQSFLSFHAIPNLFYKYLTIFGLRSHVAQAEAQINDHIVSAGAEVHQVYRLHAKLIEVAFGRHRSEIKNLEFESGAKIFVKSNEYSQWALVEIYAFSLEPVIEAVRLIEAKLETKEKANEFEGMRFIDEDGDFSDSETNGDGNKTKITAHQVLSASQKRSHSPRHLQPLTHEDFEKLSSLEEVMQTCSERLDIISNTSNGLWSSQMFRIKTNCSFLKKFPSF